MTMFGQGTNSRMMLNFGQEDYLVACSSLLRVLGTNLVLKQKAHNPDLMSFPSSLSGAAADAFPSVFDPGFSQAFSGSSNGFGQEHSGPVAANASSKASFNFRHPSLASINHPHKDVWDVLDSIGKADHDMLIRAGNNTYMKLYHEYGGMKAALEAGKKITTQLIDELAAANTRGLPDTRCLIPKYVREKYPLVTIWSKGDYDASLRNKDVMLLDNAEKVSKFPFQDEKGQLINKITVGEMFKHARAVFAHFKQEGSAAPTFTRLGVEALKFYHNEMQTKFPLLAFADNNWKSEKVGVYVYPQWWRVHGDSRDDGEVEPLAVVDDDIEVTSAPSSRSTNSTKRGRSPSPRVSGRGTKRQKLRGKRSQGSSKVTESTSNNTSSSIQVSSTEGTTVSGVTQGTSTTTPPSGATTGSATQTTTTTTTTTTATATPAGVANAAPSGVKHATSTTTTPPSGATSATQTTTTTATIPLAGAANAASAAVSGSGSPTSAAVSGSGSPTSAAVSGSGSPTSAAVSGSGSPTYGANGTTLNAPSGVGQVASTTTTPPSGATGATQTTITTATATPARVANATPSGVEHATSTTTTPPSGATSTTQTTTTTATFPLAGAANAASAAVSGSGSPTYVSKATTLNVPSGVERATFTTTTPPSGGTSAIGLQTTITATTSIADAAVPVRAPDVTPVSIGEVNHLFTAPTESSSGTVVPSQTLPAAATSPTGKVAFHSLAVPSEPAPHVAPRNVDREFSPLSISIISTLETPPRSPPSSPKPSQSPRARSGCLPADPMLASVSNALLSSNPNGKNEGGNVRPKPWQFTPAQDIDDLFSRQALRVQPPKNPLSNLFPKPKTVDTSTSATKFSPSESSAEDDVDSTDKENVNPKAPKRAGKPAKSNTYFRPSRTSQTARNLFGIDYVEKNGKILCVDFDKVWNDLDSETRKKYDEMSVAKKAVKDKPEP